MSGAPNKREKRVLDVLASGDPEPSSEFYGVGEQTLAEMCAKGWIRYFTRELDDRVVYVITDEGTEARSRKPVRKPRPTHKLTGLPPRVAPLPSRFGKPD